MFLYSHSLNREVCSSLMSSALLCAAALCDVLRLLLKVHLVICRLRKVLPRNEVSSTFEYMFKVMYNQSHETRTLVIYQYVDKALFMVAYTFLRATCRNYHVAKLTYINRDLMYKMS